MGATAGWPRASARRRDTPISYGGAGVLTVKTKFGQLARSASGTLVTLINRLAAVGVIQSGIVLAAQTFLALFPLLIGVAALLPAAVGSGIAASLRARVGISGTSEHAMRQLLAGRDGLRGGITVAGMIVIVFSATAFTRALQRVYEQSWGLPRLGVRGRLGGLVWLVGLVAYLALLGAAVRYAGSGPAGTLLRTAIVIVTAVLLWWWTPYVLLLGRVRLRALLPCGLITAAAMLALGKISTVVVPRAIKSNERQFGTIGVVFAIESWLVIVGCAIVAASVVGAVLAQASGPIGQLIRGRAELDSWRREPRVHRREPDPM
jgi:membrane protein